MSTKRRITTYLGSLALCLMAASTALAAATGTPNAARYEHTATLLNTGSVLITGGRPDTSSLNSAEEYTPSTKLFTSVANMTAARSEHSAVKLADGKVLITGGQNVSGTTATLASAEIYNPTLKTFTPTGGPMVKARASHASALLNSGKVLVVGGNNNGTAVTYAELYDPATNSFTQIASPHGTHTSNVEAFKLTGGKVAVIGGGENRASMYDPTTNTFTMVTLKASHSNQSSILMPNGKILISDTVTEVFDPAAGTSQTITGRETLHSGQIILGSAMTVMTDGTIMLAGGYYPNQGNKSAEVVDYFDPSAQTFSTTSGAGTVTLNTTLESNSSQFPQQEGRTGATATTISNGDVLIVGGKNKATSTSTSVPNQQALLYQVSGGKFFVITILHPGIRVTYNNYPNGIHFLNARMGGVVSVPVTITSTSMYADLKVTNTTATGTSSSAFQMDLSDCGSVYPYTITTTTPCTATALYMPTATSPANETATLQIESNDLLTPSFAIPVTGDGGVAVTNKLTVTKTGGGSGSFTLNPSVTASNGSYPYAPNANIIITATPSAGSKVNQWVGCDSYSVNACNVVMSSDKVVELNFALIDTTKPTGSLSLANGTSVTNSTAIDVVVNATDDSSGVTDMKFAVDAGAWTAWEAYATQKTLTVTGTGAHVLKAQFKDAAGNISDIVSFAVTVDTATPVGTVAINSGALYASSQLVTLTLQQATGSGTITQYQTSPDGTTWSAWSAFTTSPVTYMLTSGDGVKRVYVNFKNALGTVSATPVVANITLDKTPPTGTVLINGGAASTTSSTVTLTLTASDPNGSGVTKMRYDTDGDNVWSAWVAFAPQMTMQVPLIGGTRTVRVEFMDAAGNSSATVSDSIDLVVTSTLNVDFAISNSEYTKQAAVTVYNRIVSGTPSQMHFALYNESTKVWTWTTWEAFAASKILTMPVLGDGTKMIKAEYKTSVGEIASTQDSIIFDATAPGAAFKINGGATITNTPNVTLNLAPTDVVGVSQFATSVNGTIWSSWGDYNGLPEAYTLSAGDAVKTVYVKFRDMAGNESVAVTQAIVLDQTAPAGTIKINNGATSTTNPLVTVQPQITDANTVKEMQFAIDSGAWSAWEAYASTKQLTVSQSSGIKKIYARFKDAAGNVSATISSQIEITGMLADGSVTIKIAGGNAYTKLPTVTVTPLVTGTVVPTQMRYSLDGGSTWTAWETFATSKTLTLPSGDGQKTIIGQFKNSGSDTTASDTIVLDTTLPTGSFQINGGDAATNSQTVSIALSASDANTVTGYYLNSNGTWPTTPASYTTTPQTITLTGTGLRSIYVKYVDAAGNVSNPAIMQGVYVDTTPPGITSFRINNGALTTTSPTVSLQSVVTDNYSFSVKPAMQFAIDGGAWSPWEPYSATKTLTLPEVSGVRTVMARFRDDVGNISATTSASIELRTGFSSNPVVMDINSGADFTKTETVTVRMTVNGTGTLTQMRFSLDNGVTWTAWESYVPQKMLTLASVEGQKTIKGQFKSTTLTFDASDDIILDKTSPTGSFKINNGTGYTPSTTVSLLLTATDRYGVVGYQASVDGVTWPTSWSSFSGAAQNFNVSSGDGTKTVYVRFQDAAGNISPVATNNITLDTVVPTGSININGGAAATASQTVSVQSLVSDTGSTVAKMQFSVDGGAWSSWEVFAVTKSLTLTAGAGAKTVQARFMDAAGNQSAVVQATIQLTANTTNSAVTMKINSGADYTKQQTVAIAMVATGTAFTEMRFSQNGTTWTAWEPYAASKNLTLVAGDGQKVVAGEFRNTTDTVATSASIVLDSTMPTGSFKINNGAATTSELAVTLNLLANDNNSVVFYETSSDASQWTKTYFSTLPQRYTLSVGDGPKTVYVRYTDAAGNISGQTSQTILLDQTAPSGSIAINNGAATTSSTAVTVNAAVTDNGTLAKMQFAVESDAWSAWEPYAATKALTLSLAQGTKMVAARYMDLAGNISAIMTDSIQLSPNLSVGIKINDGAEFTKATAVTVKSTPTLGVPTYMRFSADGGATWTAWEVYAATKTLTLTDFDGEKTVLAEFKNATSQAAAQDSIIVDSTAPTAAVKINNGAASTSTAAVTLNFTVVDANGVAYVKTSLDGTTWGAWVAYTANMSFTLPTGDGTKKVYVRFMDKAGNVSGVVYSSINLITTAPTATISINGGAAYTKLPGVTIGMTPSGPGIVSVQFSNDNATWGSWESFTTTKAYTLPLGDGSRTVYARFKDQNENVSLVTSDSITLDTVRPEGSIKVAPGSTMNNVAVQLAASDAGSTVTKMHFSFDGVTWGAWENFATSKAFIFTSGFARIAVQYMDGAGNASVGYSVFPDTAVPTGSVKLNGGAAYSATSSVTATLTAADSGSGVAAMRLNVDNAGWGAWETFAATKAFTLSQGSHTVAVQYQDAFSNVSVVYSASIVVDTTAPAGTFVINGGATTTSTATVEITMSATDNSGSVKSYKISNDNINWSLDIPYATSTAITLPSGTGAKTLYVKFIDQAGNVSPVYSKTITLL